MTNSSLCCPSTFQIIDNEQIAVLITLARCEMGLSLGRLFIQMNEVITTYARHILHSVRAYAKVGILTFTSIA